MKRDFTDIPFNNHPFINGIVVAALFYATAATIGFAIFGR